MKKKGFTLVELLAVIAILAILVIITLPNIMSLFNQAKQNSFESELKNIYKSAQQEWMKDSMFDTKSIAYARCSENCSNKLNLSGREEINYYIELDKAGNVVKFYSTDGTYQYEYNGLGLKIEEIGNSKQVAKLESEDILNVTCTGATKGEEDIGTGGTPSENLAGTNLGEDCTGNTVANTIPSNATGLYKIMAEKAYLDNAKSPNVTTCNGVSFGDISSDTNGKGVYEIASTKDNAYPIYYYRGDVTNNNVKFAGFCWKAVRTTNTGGAKLIYNGRPDASGNCTNPTGESTRLTEGKFNNSSYSLAYAGYMYGTKDGTSTGTSYMNENKKLSASNVGYKFGKSVTYSGGTYTLTEIMEVTASNYNQPSAFNNNHYTCFSTSDTCTTVYYVYKIDGSTYYYITISEVNPNGKELIDVVKTSMFRNDRESTIKTEIEEWYRNKMTSYTNKLEDTVYCNDRTIANEAGWNPTGSMTDVLTFSGIMRVFDTQKPSLVCERANDKFTVSSSIGNGKLKYPVGLLTTDELMLAGGHGFNINYYLFTDDYYWTISPGYLDDDIVRNIHIDYDGRINDYGVNNIKSLRPVVSLSKNTSVTGGDGTANYPYVIG